MTELFTDPAWIDLDHRPRTVSFENPTGSAGTAGASFDGRKGAARTFVEAGERVPLADLDGPGRIGHFWMTVAPMPPEELRALVLEVFYDDRDEPSISVPVPDFFGAALGRPVAYQSALQSTPEGRGFNSWIPMPFRDRIRVELVNASTRRIDLYYQLDLTLGPVADEVGLLHVSFRRENPTTIRQDFTIADGFVGPGRFLGCNVGVRVFHEPAHFVWYGEGEVKMFLDADADLPTWCGTGLEDYVGTAFGMGAHQTPYQGAPLVLANPTARTAMPDLVGFYRWHLPDPIVFESRLRVTIQQIGAVFLRADQAELKAEIEASGRLVGGGWRAVGRESTAWFGICERQDDYCATAYVYCRDAQPVPPVDVAAAVADIARMEYETASPFEGHCCVSAKRTRIGARAGPVRVCKTHDATDSGSHESPIWSRAGSQRAARGLNATVPLTVPSPRPRSIGRLLRIHPEQTTAQHHRARRSRSTTIPYGKPGQPVRFAPMTTDFSTEVTKTGDATVVHVRGEIDIATCGRLRDAIEPHLGPEQNLVLDLSEVEFMDSACLGVLLQARGTLTADGGSLVLRNPSSAARRLLTAAQVEDFLQADADEHPPGESN